MNPTDAPNTLLQDITSRDAQRIWAASGAIIHTRVREELDLLAAHLSEIRTATQGVELGGALLPNSEHLKFALRKLDYWRTKAGCLCRLYPEYLMYDPKREEKDGNVYIRDTRLLDGGWVDSYLCECTVCGTRFTVEEREYHYTWWGWKITTKRA